MFDGQGWNAIRAWTTHVLVVGGSLSVFLAIYLIVERRFREKPHLWRPFRNLVTAFLFLSWILFLQGWYGAFPELRSWLLLLWISLVTLIILRAINLVWMEDFFRAKQIPQLLRQIVNAFLFVIVISVAIQRLFRVELTPILTTSAVITVVIGLALQETLSNLFSGIGLNIEEAFYIGDWIQIGSHIGRIQEINWRSVHLITRTGETVVYPNAAVAREIIVNYSRPAGTPRIHTLTIGLPYEVPPEQVERAVLEVLRDFDLPHDPPPTVHLVAFDDFSVRYEIRYPYDDFGPLHRMDAEIRRRLWYTLKRYGIDIPFPIRTVYLQQPHDTLSEMRARMLETLRTQAIFQGIPETDLQRLVDDCHVRMYARGQTIFRQGDPPDGMYLIMQGTVDILVRRHRHTHTVATLRDGQIFGEIALIQTDRRTATARAQRDTWLVFVPTSVARAWMESVPVFRDNLMRLFESRWDELQAFWAEETASTTRSGDVPDREVRRSWLLRKLLGLG